MKKRVAVGSQVGRIAPRFNAARLRAAMFVLASFALAAPALATSLAATADSYLADAARVRRATDRPWRPEAGQLGNLRHVQITARDCVVRIVSGNENRVFPGSRDVIAVEQSRVLDAEPDEQPAPRDVVLAPDRAQACPGIGACGVSITSVTQAPKPIGDDAACFTLQVATANDLLIGGDGLVVLIDRLRQPALRLNVNPSADLKVWLEHVELGFLAVSANAPVRLGGNGQIDFLAASSSDGGSFMYLHTFDARHVGLTTTTTGTQWSIRIGDATEARYSQPARAPGWLAENYPVEIDGPIERLDVPIGRVDPLPLSEATRNAARALRGDVFARAGRTPIFPTSDLPLKSAVAAAATLPPSPQQRVADVIARYLPASVQITAVTLWKEGGRLEGTAPDAATARDIPTLLTQSGEFIFVNGGGGLPRDGRYTFSTQLTFSCEVPGGVSKCPAGDAATPGHYSEAQVRAAIMGLLDARTTVQTLSLRGDTIRLEAMAHSLADARADLDRISHGGDGLFRLSTSGYGPAREDGSAAVSATLRLICATPPRTDGICAARPL